MNETFRTFRMFEGTSMNSIRRKKLTKTLLRRYEQYLSEQENDAIDFLVNTKKIIL